jgi:hypothetical protein
MAQAVIGHTEVLSDTELDFLDSIRQWVNEMVNTTKLEHDENQKMVNKARDDFTDCHNDTPALREALNKTDVGEECHDDCRGLQKKQNETKKDKCKKYSEAVIGQTAPPGCMEQYNASAENIEATHACLVHIVEWALPVNETLRAFSTDCSTASSHLILADKLCDGHQLEFEKYACTYRFDKLSVCATYDGCRKDKIKHRNETHADARVLEAGRKAAFTAARNILCYLDIFSDDRADPQNLNHCKNATYNTSSLDIFYPDTPPERDCEDVDFPCMNGWLADHYVTKPWHAMAPPNQCSPCS